jgi:hypothetical protein
VVHAQTESEWQVPFSTEKALLDMARLLSQMNREIELGIDIDSNLLLSLLGNIFPPQDDPTNNNSLQAALIASVSHAQQQQRLNEPKSRPVDLGNDKSHRGKRKQDARDSNTGEISTLDRILSSLNDVKSEVEGFQKLLLDH